MAVSLYHNSVPPFLEALGRVTPRQFAEVCKFVGGTQLPPDAAKHVLKALDHAALSAGIDQGFVPYATARAYLEALVAKAERDPRSAP